ncbi:SurA N-terminal domain-containing protein [Alteribacillus bidgolensis]|uniref:peptidylprolyl isomerase n=1 Tax=Alteribacillus bidgolensis TaxID=930129 RepID=A0A1G8D2F9_9BACI|nr:SurA N-terminal domain-containing protein [Alteribacillus bidgolensis]SDH52017.1 peptidyl-prolyl cis-trans isomerase SurA [Alteribacillus bidgolensis]
MSKKWILSLALAVSVLVTAACGDEEGQEGEGQQQEEGQEEKAQEEKAQEEAPEEQEMPEPDLEDIPDVVAEVNGEEISKDEFESVYVSTLNTYAMQGMNIEEQDDGGKMKQQIQEQTVEQLIGQELLVQEADKRELSASEDEIKEELNSLKEQFGSDEEFQKALESENLSEDELQSDIEKQVKVEKLVKDEAGEIEVSEDELRDMYEQMSQGQQGEEGEDSPSFEEMKPQLEEQMVQQKEGEEIQKLVEELRESGDVTVNI